MADFFIYLFSFLGLLLGLGSIGLPIVLSFQQSTLSHVERLLYALAVSIFIFVITLSIYCTSGVTVSVLMIGPVVVIALHLGGAKRIKLNELLHVYKYSSLFIIHAVLFYTFLWLIHYPIILEDKVSHPDYAFYGDVSEFFLLKGIESTDIYNALYWNSKASPNPYHYFEIWFTSFANLIFPERPGVINYLFIGYPILLFSVYLGFVSMLKMLFKLNYFSLSILGFLMMFIGPAFLDLSEIKNVFANTAPMAPMAKKYASLFLLSILTLKALHYKKYLIFASLASLFLFISVGTVAIPLASGLVLLLYYIIRKEIIFLKGFFVLLSSTVLFVVFYLIFSASTSLSQTGVVPLVIEFTNAPNGLLLKKYFGLSLELLWRMIVGLNITLVLGSIAIVYRKQSFFIMLLLSFLILIAVLLSTALYPIINNNQFLYNVLPFMNMGIIYLIIITLLSIQKRLYYTIFLLLGIILALINFNGYLKNENSFQKDAMTNQFTKVQKEFLLTNLHSKCKLAIVKNYEFDYGCEMVYGLPGWFMNFKKKGMFMVPFLNTNKNCLSLYKSRKMHIVFQPFVLASVHNITQEEEILPDFLVQNDIEYLLIEDGAEFSNPYLILTEVAGFSSQNIRLFKIDLTERHE